MSLLKTPKAQEILELFQYYRRTEGSSSSLPPLPAFRKWRDEFHSLALGLIQPLGPIGQILMLGCEPH